MQIIVKNENGNGLIFGIPQRDLDRARALSMQLYYCCCTLCHMESLRTLANGQRKRGTRRVCKGLFLVIFA